MDVLRWFNGFDPVPGMQSDMRWASLTLALSALVAVGYALIAFNWYFQRKLARHAESRAAQARLGILVCLCAAAGYVFFATDMAWTVWRLYDALLLVLAGYTWSFASRMRGVGLVNERLARIEELERSAEKYREIAELLPHMVWTADEHGAVDFSNERWSRYAGDRTWLDAVHPDERERVREWWAFTVARREPAHREVRLRGFAGYRTFVVNATPIAHGPVVKWLGACADIEDEKLLAAERENQAKRKAFLLNALSHDLRAPLNNVVLNAHLLKMSTQDPSQLELADTVVDNAIAAGDLVTRLLDFSKVGAEERNADETFPVHPVLRQVVRRFQPAVEQKGLYLRLDELPAAGVDVGDDVPLLADPSLHADRLKFERVVSNLVDNAIKYTESGGVTISLGPAPGRPGGRLAVRISDTGIGIPEQSVPRLFDEFYQVNNHERDRSKGFGIGLAICRCLAQQLGGDVRLAHTGPGGSCFELTVAGLRPGGRGRPDGAEGDHAHPHGAGLCPV